MIYTYKDNRGATWETLMVQTAQNPEFSFYWHNEDKNCDIFDWSVRPCAYGGEGCPAVMLVEVDGAANTRFTRDWQYYLVAINYGMSLNNIWSLLGPQKALTNRDPDKPVRNYILEENLDADEDPRLDKLRTFSRNTHAVEGGRLITMNGLNPPAMKPGKSLPQSLEEINPDDYLYHPRTHPYLFLTCNNVQVKPGNVTSVFPFAHGITRDWLDNEIYTFFPFVSTHPVYIRPQNWTRLEPGEFVHPYRRVG